MTVTRDDMTLDEVAARLGKSPRWLQSRLADDARCRAPELQFHHYVGRSPRWTENEYQALRQAIVAKDTAARQKPPLACGSSSETDSGTLSALCALADAQSAFARVLEFQRRPAPGKPPKNSARTRKVQSGTRPSSGSSQASPSLLRLINT